MPDKDGWWWHWQDGDATHDLDASPAIVVEIEMISATPHAWFTREDDCCPVRDDGRTGIAGWWLEIPTPEQYAKLVERAESMEQWGRERDLRD